MSAQLARLGFTGPKSFLEGVYGYFHLYAKDARDPETVAGDLGQRFEFLETIFKKFPSCFDTYASTQAALDLVAERNPDPADIEAINIKVTPYVFKLVGGEFRIGPSPKINAQFNIKYCVSNAVLRRGSKLDHFEDDRVRDPRIMEMVKKIEVVSDHGLDPRGETAIDMKVTFKGGSVWERSLDFPPGSPENPLSEEEHARRFQSCIEFGGDALPRQNVEEIEAAVRGLEDIEDVGVLISLLSN